MSTVDELLKKVEGKLRMLKFMSDETPSVLGMNKQKQIERHVKVLESLIEEVHDLKVEVQRKRIEKGDDLTEVRTWSRDLEQTVLEFENVISEVKQQSEKLCEIELQKAKDKERGIEKEKRRKRYEEEMAFKEAKLELKRKFKKGLEEVKMKSASQCNSAKLPKLTRYGKESEVANAHMQSIISLPTISGSDARKINSFFKTLVANTQALETMGKLNEVKGFARSTLDKLPGIRADLVRSDDNWQDWGFGEMVEALRKCCVRNPISEEDHKSDHKGTSHYQQKSGKLLHAKQELWKPRPCVFCESTLHKSVDCDQVVDITSRKKILLEKKLCFNCTGVKHRASECQNKTTCFRCNAKHHTSICDDQGSATKQMMLATGKGTVIYPVVVAVVNGIKCKALLDTGAGSSYISADLVKLLRKQPSRTEYRHIDMMMSSTTQRIEIYDVIMADVRGKFEMKTQMDDEDTKAELPIHLILGGGDYSRIKTTTKPRLGHPGQPIAELTALVWTMMSAGEEVDFSNIYLTKSPAADYEELCSLDVLGLKDHPQHYQQFIYKEFQEQLTQSDEGWYETRLLWKPGHDPLPNNKRNSIGRLSGLLKRLQRDPELLTQYDDIIQNQKIQGIVEEVTNDPVGKEFYLPHRPVIRKSAESTKVRIVYDASSKEMALSGDLEQAFLQVQVRGQDRDSLRFHWIKDKDLLNVEVLRITRVVFGLVQSPFLLGGTIQCLLESMRQKYPIEVAEIKKNLYVDDVISGGETTEAVRGLKSMAVEIFKHGKFTLHKWHSNKLDLEGGSQPTEINQSYAKEQLGVKPGETKLLGLPWNKARDTIATVFPDNTPVTTKREMLRFLASIYDPLGIVSPISLVGKLLYRDVCDQRWPWDAKSPPQIFKRWRKLENALPKQMEVPHSIAAFEELIEAVHLHAFGDTSSDGTCAAVYTLVHQQSGVNPGLVAAKSRLAKKNLTIPRLELVSAHMAANLIDNVKNALSYPVTSVFGWLDSTTALYWIKGNGNYKEFVANITKKIKYQNWSIVLIKNDERNRSKWNLSVVVKPIKGRDGVVRAVRLQAGKSYLDRAVQQLYPLELECDDPPVVKPAVVLNAEAREFRPKRKAAQEAEKLIKNVAEFELES
ncbi:uncharacterized protein LOC114528347 [Dendronephthya gigantea]|uniref:uncharacterized protein LOC114528347 n=1 Tax=Dendronephthya gigantea TaxID=151771 RepID=UPI00106C08A7|nr:uncharacterized protein LOC114528347 [Dendronephthya gigantea]